MSNRRQWLAASGALLAAGGATSAAAETDPSGDTLYGHGTVWNRDLPGLGGRLNLSFDLRVNLKTGTGGGTAADPVFPGESFHFSITQTLRERVHKEERFTLDGVVTDAVNAAYQGLPVRIVAQTQGEGTSVAIRIGEVVYSGAGLLLIFIIAILIG